MNKRFWDLNQTIGEINRNTTSTLLSTKRSLDSADVSRIVRDRHDFCTINMAESNRVLAIRKRETGGCCSPKCTSRVGSIKFDVWDPAPVSIVSTSGVSSHDYTNSVTGVSPQPHRKVAQPSEVAQLLWTCQGLTLCAHKWIPSLRCLVCQEFPTCCWSPDCCCPDPSVWHLHLHSESRNFACHTCGQKLEYMYICMSVCM